MRKVRCPSCMGQKTIARVGGLDTNPCKHCEAKGHLFLVPEELLESSHIDDISFNEPLEPRRIPAKTKIKKEVA